ncbi:MAG: Asp23/Gls24 family envelope stress response protein [Firmicutes bacterium]|nr:Asp23/Gls24 family envelope stress response protein [Bacillota bacterium]
MEEKISFSDAIIAVCAVNATLKTDGVFEMAGGVYDALSKNLLGIESVARGTKVSRSGDETKVDISIIADYGCNIPSMAWDIQENVRNEIREMTNIDVSAVNIHVQGVKMPGQEEETN